MKKSKINIQKSQEIIIYRSKKGNVTLRADLRKETVWATQAQISELFGVDRTVITKHINNILKDKELEEKTVCANFAHTAKDGKTYTVQHYNLDVILSVGYRVNSKQATQFRIWATETLHEYIIHGMAVNTERIKKLSDEHIAYLTKKISFIQNTIGKRQLDKK